jgi:hypothetical protein
MGASDMSDMKPLQEKAVSAVIEEFERQAAEHPERLQLSRKGDGVTLRGEIDVDALVMVVVGAMAGGP